MDEELNKLKRMLQACPGDRELELRWRKMMVRAGQASEVPFCEGDIVEVDEQSDPWIRGKWKGEVRRRFEYGDCYVSPVQPKSELTYRAYPRTTYIRKGLYLTREDVKLVIEARGYIKHEPEPIPVTKSRCQVCGELPEKPCRTKFGTKAKSKHKGASNA